MELIIDPIVESPRRTTLAYFVALVVAFPAFYFLIMAGAFIPLSAIIFSGIRYPEAIVVAALHAAFYLVVYYFVARTLANRTFIRQDIAGRRSFFSRVILILLLPAFLPIYFFIGDGGHRWLSWPQTFTIFGRHAR